MLIEGQWTASWHPYQSQDERGRFVRQTSSFRRVVGRDAGLEPEAGRYRLYVAFICPWASRVLMVRALKKLHDLIPVTVVEPALSEQGWRFGPALGASGSDPEQGAAYLHQLYAKADPHFTGRATVPVLWDRHEQTIVNNESADLVRMLGSAFDSVGGDADVDLYPQSLREDIDALSERMYVRLNNGVYRAGFAKTQAAYDEAVVGVFDELDALERLLSDGRPFLLGERLTESDVRAFVSLVRFDVAYHGLFKCNLRALTDYSALSAYVERIEALPGVAETVRRDHIKHGYYSVRALNPSGIVPMGPSIEQAPAARDETRHVV